MKVGIIGAGAMGSLFSYFFNRKNIHVQMYDCNSNIVNSLQKGLIIQLNNEENTYPVSVSNNPKDLKDCDILFLFIKSYGTEDAVKTIKDHISKNAVIVTLQNGLGNVEKIKMYLKEHQIVYGTTTIGATKTDSNKVVFGGAGDITVGGADKETHSIIYDLFEDTGISLSFTDDPMTALWKKVIVNAGINPIAAIMNIPNGEIVANPYTLNLQKNIISETVTVAAHLGMGFNSEELLAFTKTVCTKTAKNICSMLQDIRNEKRTEIDSITGKIIEHAENSGIYAPYNITMYNLVKGKELSYL